jgi:hypothetical protein
LFAVKKPFAESSQAACRAIWYAANDIPEQRTVLYRMSPPIAGY